MTPPSAVVVGTGFGTRVHVPALRAAGFEVVALVGRDLERTERRAERLGVPRALVDLDAALALPGVEAVTVATPPHQHAPVVRAAARAGKHVLCEKPFAMNAAEAEAMLEEVEAAGVTHLVAHEFRWAVDRAVVGRTIAGGRIGRPALVSLVQLVPIVAGLAARTPGWWFDEAAGGGWLGASGSHAIDQVRCWLGDFAEVSARLTVTSAREQVADDTFTMRFRLRNGVDGVIQQTGAAWGPGAGTTAVAGSDGTAWVEHGDAWLADAEGARRLPVPSDLALPSSPARSDDPRQRFTHLELGPFIRLCEVLRAGVEGWPRPDAVPVPTFADGLACTRVLDAARDSNARGGLTVEL